ncbi:MAG: heat-inducible transcriptional repressor HrcA [Chloroflexota bacterium]|nr:heat-inducible transcriptional repressor HrcA [Chloroflexota bacterium]
MEKQLTDRSKQVLKLVIEEYIATARPVGSEVLREKYKLAVSSATLRAEMAELERQGYLAHRHTSGGRVPSESGYRMFVENLMNRMGLSSADMRRVEHQFHQVEGNPDLTRWAELAASVLAQLARNAALVTVPRSDAKTLKQVQLIHLNDRSALTVAVMNDGSVRQSVCVLPYASSQEELNSVSAALNAAFVGFVPLEMSVRAQALSGIAADVAPQVLGVVSQTGLNGTVSQSGLMNMLAQPEFRQSDASRPLVEILEGGALVNELADRIVNRPGVHVIIGSENPLQEMARCSIVTAAYTAQGGGYGLLTVVGPTRMQYERTISSVYYVSRLLSSMLHADSENTRHAESRRFDDTAD